MLDYNQQFPNQEIDNNQTECVALTVTDICGNIDSQLYDPDFSYAFTLKLLGVQPTTAGLDPYSGMLSAVAYGLLPISLETFTSKVMGELYAANFQNYPSKDPPAALKWAMRGVKQFYSYQDIIRHLDASKTGVALAMRWYSSFNTPNQDGSLPAPIGQFSHHMVAVYGHDARGLQIKPWLGKDFGQGGYTYLSEATFNLVVQSAFAFDPAAWRWMSLAKIAVSHPKIIGDILPQLTA